MLFGMLQMSTGTPRSLTLVAQQQLYASMVCRKYGDWRNLHPLSLVPLRERIDAHEHINADFLRPERPYVLDLLCYLSCTISAVPGRVVAHDPPPRTVSLPRNVPNG